MSLVSASLPSLANGISQQPPTARLSSQGEDQQNGYSSIVEGNAKRSPTHHIAKMIAGTVGPISMHLINRDVTERYEVVIANNSIRVFDLAGAEQTVNYDPKVALAARDYLICDDAQTAFRAVTIADYTILVNTEKTVRMDHYAGSAQLVISGNYQVGDTFQLKVNVTTINYTVVTGQTDQNSVITGLNTAIAASLPADMSTTAVTSVGIDLKRVTPVQEGTFTIEFYFNGDEVIPNDGSSTPGLTTARPESNPGIFYVKQGNYGTKYTVLVEDSLNTFNATITTSNTVVTDIDTSTIATNLYNTLVALANFNTYYTATKSGSLIRVKRISDNGAFRIKAEDGNGNKNLIALKGSVQKFTDLPSSCFPDFRMKIIGDVANDEDDYYVQFVVDGSPSADLAVQGTWDEVAYPYEDVQFRASTMPMTLIRLADGTFYFTQPNGQLSNAGWDARQAGDSESDPPPSFTNKKITDVVFFRNRLGFLSDENIIQSAAGDYFRFFRGTVTAVLDGDPIDVAASNVSVSILRNAVPFSENKMLLFSDQKQFIYSGGDLLTPKTAAIKPSTAYEATPGCKPIAVGKAVYFPMPLGDNSGMREYSTDVTSGVDDAVDITAHVPSFIPANIFKIAAAPNENILLALSRDDPSAIYVYKFFFVAQDKLQASWSKWTMEGEILDVNFLGSTAYFAIKRSDGLFLESMGIEAFRNDTSMTYEVLLDRRFTAGVGGLITGSYNANTNLTTYTLPYQTTKEVQAVVRGDATIPAGYYESQLFPTVAVNTSVVTIIGDTHLVPFIMGTVYEYVYEFSEIVLKQTAGAGGERPITGGRLQVRTLSIVFDNTGYFRVEVTPQFGDTWSYSQTPKILGQYVTGSLEMQGGVLRFPVASKSDEVTIRVINDSPYPSRLLSAAWEGEFILRTRRM